MFEIENIECTCACEPCIKTNKKIHTFPDDFTKKSLTISFNVGYIDKEFFNVNDNKRRN